LITKKTIGNNNQLLKKNQWCIDHEKRLIGPIGLLQQDNLIGKMKKSILDEKERLIGTHRKESIKKVKKIKNLENP
jgi:hypothetical protein